MTPLERAKTDLRFAIVCLRKARTAKARAGVVPIITTHDFDTVLDEGSEAFKEVHKFLAAGNRVPWPGDPGTSPEDWMTTKRSGGAS